MGTTKHPCAQEGAGGRLDARESSCLRASGEDPGAAAAELVEAVDAVCVYVCVCVFVCVFSKISLSFFLSLSFSLLGSLLLSLSLSLSPSLSVSICVRACHVYV